MYIKSILTIIAATAFTITQAQEMNGFRMDNYNGVNGAFFNPANLGSGPYKIDVNILGINVLAGNKNMNFNFNTFSDFNSDGGVLGKIIGTEQPNSLVGAVSLHLPSVSYCINPKTTVAFVSRSRVLFDAKDLDGKLLTSISGDVSSAGTSFSIANNENMRMNVNAFAELGFSAGRVIYDKGNHFIRVGATVKYLGGIGNSYLQLDNLKTTVNSDANGQNSYATNSSGTVAIGVGGLDISHLDDVQFNFKASGLGADLGAVYEYRPGSLSDETNKYLFKISAAVLDIGSIKYNAISQYTVGYNINIPAGQQFALDVLSGTSITEVSKVLDTYPQYFSRTKGLNANTYKVALPHTLQLAADLRTLKNIYVSANAQIAMNNNDSKPYNPGSLNSITLTPRYEGRLFAAYLPVHYNTFSKTTIGFGFRAGPFYAGSSSIVSMAIAKTKQADFYFGFRVGIKSRKERQEEI